jgi:hypothetical protein
MTSGSRGEAADEDMQRGIPDFGAEEMPDDSTFFMSEEGGGFVGRAKARSLLAARGAEAAGGGEALGQGRAVRALLSEQRPGGGLGCASERS